MPENHGIIACALTPRDSKGALDFGAAFELIDYLSKAKVKGIALFTPAGEYPAFSLDDRARLVYLAVKRSRVPVYAGIGSFGLDDSLTLAREARRGGAEGVFLPPSHFFPYQQPELTEFYLQFARQLAGGIPVYLSNTPVFTSGLETPTICALLSSGHFAGMEDPLAADRALSHLPVALLSSDDSRLAEARRAGCHGAVSVAACAIPELVVALDSALGHGDRVRAERCDALLQQFVARDTQFPFPVMVHAATRLRGVKLGVQPVPLSAGRQRALDEFREWFTGWLSCLKNLD
jgi:4-hydroxy-tetrahydrodipicolinate synthase